ncbi:hypothetical protein GCM10010295_44170 [Streptomyces intermedius]
MAARRVTGGARGVCHPGPGWRYRPVNLVGVDPKTRNRIMAGVLVLMFAVIAVSAAVGA